MKKIFLDCGANNGMSIDMFRDKIDTTNEFTIHAFECNPCLITLLEKYKNDMTFIYDRAVWIHNNTAPFYLGDSLSSSLNITKTTGRLNKHSPITVQCIRLSEFIQNNFSVDDYIILKLDIEGAEYDVLLDLIETDTLKYINKLYGEFHNRKVASHYTDQYIKITQYLYEINLPMHNWSADEGKLEY